MKLTKNVLEEIDFKKLNGDWYELDGKVSQFNSGTYRLRMNITSDFKVIITLSDVSIDDEHIFNGRIKTMKQLIRVIKYLDLERL